MRDPRRPPLQGHRILVVEDDYFLAADLCRELEAEGAQVLGPVSRVADAFTLLDRESPPDVAILDVELGDELVFPLAEVLTSRAIPFVFATGYDRLPPLFVQVPRCEKPVRPGDLARMMAAVGL